MGSVFAGIAGWSGMLMAPTTPRSPPSAEQPGDEKKASHDPRDPPLGRRLPGEYGLLAQQGYRPHHRHAWGNLGPGGQSLASRLSWAARRQFPGAIPGRSAGARNIKQLPPLTEEQILTWADRHKEREGKWPARTSGYIPGTDGESWATVDGALRIGSRGLPGGSSLVRLLASHKGVRNDKALPPLSREQILGWADAHHAHRPLAGRQEWSNP